jgi:hypothetical protein
VSDPTEWAGAEHEVTEAFEAYEAALLANDVAAMDGAFWADERVVRYGIGEVQVGIDAIRAWRATTAPVPPTRRLTSRHVLALGPDVVAVDVTFVNGDEPGTGRQSQTWVRRPEGWRIARAHVSMIA